MSAQCCNQSGVWRLGLIAGNGDKQTEVISSGEQCAGFKGAVVYFGGDVQVCVYVCSTAFKSDPFSK